MSQNEPLTRLLEALPEGARETAERIISERFANPMHNVTLLRDCAALLDAARAKVAALEAELARLRPVALAAVDWLMCREALERLQAGGKPSIAGATKEYIDALGCVVASLNRVQEAAAPLAAALAAAEAGPKEERT